MPGLSRRQIIAWSLAGLVVLAIGAGYLRSHLVATQRGAPTAVTIGIGTKEERPARIKIHIVGAVARPGLYDADASARVADALQLAGGPTPTADLAQINLAAKIADGQQLIVPEKGVASAASAGPSASSSKQPVNLNSATADQLMDLDGIGPKTAQKIIEYRDAHGGFKSVEELLEVPGIGPAKLEQIKGQVVL